MEGRFPKGIRLVLTRCSDPSRESEFNDWYTRVHLRDVLASGLVTHAIRYQNADSQPADIPYLAIYEMEREDLEVVSEEISAVAQRLAAEGRIHPALEIVRRETWRAVGPEFRTAATGTIGATGVFVVESRCTDPAREAEFNQWYDGMHIQDLFDTGLFHTAYRFLAAPPGPRSRYLAIYETGAPDPLEAVQEFTRVHRPRLQAAGRLSNIIEVTQRTVFRRLTSV